MIANLKTIAGPMLHNGCAILCLATAGLAPCLQAPCSIFASSVQQTRQTPRSATCAHIVFVRLVQPYPDTLQHIGGPCAAYLQALCSIFASPVQHNCSPCAAWCRGFRPRLQEESTEAPMSCKAAIASSQLEAAAVCMAVKCLQRHHGAPRLLPHRSLGGGDLLRWLLLGHRCSRGSGKARKLALRDQGIRRFTFEQDSCPCSSHGEQIVEVVECISLIIWKSFTYLNFPRAL